MTKKTEVKVSAGPTLDLERREQTSITKTATPDRCECQGNACSHAIDSRHPSAARKGSSTSSEGKDTAAHQFTISARDRNDGEFDKSLLQNFLRGGAVTESQPHLYGPIARLYKSSSELLRALLLSNTRNVNATYQTAKTDPGHQRALAECGHCRQWKVKCTPVTKDPQGRCIACIRAKTKCTDFVADKATSYTVGASQAKGQLASTKLDKKWHTAPGEGPRVFRELEGIYHLFILWGDGHDILEGRLDDLLEQSIKLRSDVISLLRSIGKKLTRGCLNDNLAREDVAKHVAQLDDAREETRFGVASDEEDSSESEDESLVRDGSHHHSAEDLDDLIEDLDTDVQCLTELTPALQSPAREGCDEAVQSCEKSVRSLAQEHCWGLPGHSCPSTVSLANVGLGPTITEHRPFTELIRSSFPKADLDLAERLGQLNWERWLRLQEQRRSNEEEKYQEILQLDARTVAPSSKFHDSGIGASLPATTRYAPSLAPSIASSVISSILEGNRPTMPPLPKSAESGDPFTCLACSRLVSVSTKELWKKHLMSDLKPYVCVFPGCRLSSSPTLGLSYSFWVGHLKSQHPHGPGGWECPLCFKQVGTDTRRFCTHISRHMEDIAMATLPRDCESENNSAIGDELTSYGGEEDGPKHGQEEYVAAGTFTKSLLVYNLGDKFDDKELNKLFEGIENVVDVRIMTNPDGSSKAFGYADFLDEISAQRAFADLKMRSIFGDQVGVEFVVPTEEFGNFEARLSAKKPQEELQAGLPYAGSNQAGYPSPIPQFARYREAYFNDLMRTHNSIDSHPLDLYGLTQAVHTRGGFAAVCDSREWAAISHELGLSGNSISASLRNAYQKWLLPYEERLQAVFPIEPIADETTSDDVPRAIQRAGPEQQPSLLEPNQANFAPEKGMIYNPVLQRWESNEAAPVAIEEPENSPPAALEVKDKSKVEEVHNIESEPEFRHKPFSVAILHPQRGHSDLVIAGHIAERESLISDKVVSRLNLPSDPNRESTIKLTWWLPDEGAAKTHTTRFTIIPDPQIDNDLALGHNAYKAPDDNFYFDNYLLLPTDSLFLGNLDHETSEEELWFLFTNVENVIDAWTVVDNETSLCKGFGYARFADSTSAQNALRLLHGKELNGRPLRVDYTRSGTCRPEKFSGSNNFQGHETGSGTKIDAQRPASPKHGASTTPPRQAERKESQKAMSRSSSEIEHGVQKLFDHEGVRTKGATQAPEPPVPNPITLTYWSSFSFDQANTAMGQAQEQQLESVFMSEPTQWDPAGILEPPTPTPENPITPIHGSFQQKKHTCPYCSAEFTTYHNLKSHLLTHNQDKPYVCISCQARFRRLHELKRHTKLHAQERRKREDDGNGGKASISSVTFPAAEPESWARSPSPDSIEESSDLLTHSQGKPYACAYCEARFQGHHDLIHHSKMHISEGRKSSDDKSDRQTDSDFVTIQPEERVSRVFTSSTCPPSKPYILR